MNQVSFKLYTCKHINCKYWSVIKYAYKQHILNFHFGFEHTLFIGDESYMFECSIKNCLFKTNDEHDHHQHMQLHKNDIF